MNWRQRAVTRHGNFRSKAKPTAIVAFLASIVVLSGGSRGVAGTLSSPRSSAPASVTAGENNAPVVATGTVTGTVTIDGGPPSP